MIRKAIITGGNGYVGSTALRQLLRDGVEVHAIANENSDRLAELLPSNCIHSISKDHKQVAAFVEVCQPDAIFHLAAIHAEPPSFDQMMAMLDASPLLGVALLHGAAECKRPPVFVHAGTYWQFGENGYSPNTFYASAKQALHDLLIYFRNSRNIPALTLVLYDIFGPADTRPKLWSTLLHAKPGSHLPLTEGRQRVELVHVEDAARAFVRAANLLSEGEPLGLFYAVRSTENITLRELLETLKERAGLDLHFDWGAIEYWPGQIFEPWEGDFLPGWRPSVPLVDGIVELLRGAASSRLPESIAALHNELP